MPKNCDKCGDSFTGFGTTCPKCRKLSRNSGGMGVQKSCSECGVYFTGFGTQCDTCAKTDVNNCATCGKPVYVVDRLTIEGRSFHPQCFRCHKCQCKLGVNNWSRSEKGTYYCKVHFEQLFKLRGRYSVDSLDKVANGQGRAVGREMTVTSEMPIRKAAGVRNSPPEDEFAMPSDDEFAGDMAAQMTLPPVAEAKSENSQEDTERGGKEGEEQERPAPREEAADAAEEAREEAKEVPAEEGAAKTVEPA